MNQYLVTNSDGAPSAFVDLDQIQAQATRLAFDMAEAVDDEAELTRIAERHLAEVGPDAFGYVSAAAVRIFAEHILSPVLEVCDVLHENGLLAHNVRDGLAGAAAQTRAAATSKGANR